MSTVHHDIATPGPPELREVDDGIFAYIQPDGSWWINNIAIETVTAQPVRTVINTHHHGDHTFGNFLMTGATIVGHEATRTGVLDWGEPQSYPFWTEVDWGEVVLEPPFLTYIDAVTVWVDELRADVRHVGMPAHTTNDSIVWLPERKVLYCGALLFNGGTPFLVLVAAVMRDSRRWRPHANWTSDRTRPSWIASASSAICTGPMPNSTAPRWVRPSTSPRR